MTTITKAILAEKLSDQIGLPKSECQRFIERFFEVISSHLETGFPVKLSGFGKFITIDKRSRVGRNPRTKEEAEITARRVVSFKAGGKLIRRIEQSLRKK